MYKNIVYILTIAFISLSINLVNSAGYDFLPIELKFTHSNGPKSDVYIDLKIKKAKRATCITGNVTIQNDMDNNYELTCDVEYSSTGSSLYLKSPYRLPKTQFCNVLQKFYKKYIQEPMKAPTSNFPYFEGEPKCPFPKGLYEIRNFSFEGYKAPDNIPSGSYRTTCELHKLGKFVLTTFYNFKVIPSGGP